MSDKTLSFADRIQCAETIQAALARAPDGKKFGLRMSHTEAVQLIGTLRGHDLIDLGDDIYKAFGTEGEMGDVIVDVITRMDEDEYDRIVAFLRHKLLNQPQAVESEKEKSPLERLLEIHPNAAIAWGGETETSEQLLARLDRSLGYADHGDPGDETDAPAALPEKEVVVRNSYALTFKGDSREEMVDFLRRVIDNPDRYLTAA